MFNGASKKQLSIFAVEDSYGDMALNLQYTVYRNSSETKKNIKEDNSCSY
jgi:predicted porin